MTLPFYMFYPLGLRTSSFGFETDSFTDFGFSVFESFGKGYGHSSYSSSERTSSGNSIWRMPSLWGVYDSLNEHSSYKSKFLPDFDKAYGKSFANKAEAGVAPSDNPKSDSKFPLPPAPSSNAVPMKTFPSQGRTITIGGITYKEASKFEVHDKNDDHTFIVADGATGTEEIRKLKGNEEAWLFVPDFKFNPTDTAGVGIWLEIGEASSQKANEVKFNAIYADLAKETAYAVGTDHFYAHQHTMEATGTIDGNDIKFEFDTGPSTYDLKSLFDSGIATDSDAKVLVVNQFGLFTISRGTAINANAVPDPLYSVKPISPGEQVTKIQSLGFNVQFTYHDNKMADILAGIDKIMRGDKSDMQNLRVKLDQLSDDEYYRYYKLLVGLDEFLENNGCSRTKDRKIPSPASPTPPVAAGAVFDPLDPLNSNPTMQPGNIAPLQTSFGPAGYNSSQNIIAPPPITPPGPVVPPGTTIPPPVQPTSRYFR